MICTMKGIMLRRLQALLNGQYELWGTVLVLRLGDVVL
jgi:hypothetical protein